MDWRVKYFDWNQARTFLAVAQEGSLSAAGRVLGLAQPTVGRQIAALEEELGVALVERVGRGVRLTPTGVELVEHVRAMDEAALRVVRVAEGQSVSLEGPISITAGEAISAFVLPGVLGVLREEHPGIEVEVVATNVPVDVLGREADIALRNFCPQEEDLVARKVGEGRARLYATPGYLESCGDPETLDEVSRCAFVGFDRTDVLMRGLNALGLSLTRRSFPLVTSNQLVQWEFVRRGLGVGVMMEDIGDGDASVRRVLSQEVYIPVPMWLVCHRELRTSRRVRVVFDRLVEVLVDRYGGE